MPKPLGGFVTDGLPSDKYLASGEGLTHITALHKISNDEEGKTTIVGLIMILILVATIGLGLPKIVRKVITDNDC